jgi:hypothetical protein
MREIKESFFVNLGIEKGIDEIIKRHPRFRGRKKEIINHIDSVRLKERVYDIYQNLSRKNISEKKRREYIVNELADYISTGLALDDDGKEIILLKGLEEKARSGFIRGYRARKMLKGEEYLDRAIGIAHNLSYLMEKGNYREKMPEIAEAASTLEDMQLLDPLIKILRHNGILDKREYRFLQNRVYETAMSSQERIKGGIEKYLQPEKIAASILALAGLGILFFNQNVTGAVIDTYEKAGTGITGMIMIIVSLVLLLRRKKL